MTRVAFLIWRMTELLHTKFKIHIIQFDKITYYNPLMRT